MADFEAPLHLPESFEESSIQTLTDGAFYISEFLTETEEAYILEKIFSRPVSSWTNLSHRRLLCYPHSLLDRNEMLAAPLPPFIENPIVARLLSIPSSTHDSSPLIPGGKDSRGSINHIFSSSPHARPNHCLINEYPIAAGIFPHEDGPAYHPIVATVSLGAHTVLDIYKKDNSEDKKCPDPSWRLLQERRSLLVTTGYLYRDTLHGIAKVAVDENLTPDNVANWLLLREETRQKCESSGWRLERALRVSITLRDVIKVRDLRRLIPSLVGKR